jgi:DNA-binding ferritin-like protein
MEQLSQCAALYVATLKAISLIHQQSHWLCKGDNFYGSHLLFERLYKSALEDLDLAAEKFIGVLGSEVLDYNLQAKLLGKILLTYSNFDAKKPALTCLAIEQDFLKMSEKMFEDFEEDGEMTLGISDMIPAISSNREEAVYLLQQSLK